MLVSESHRFIFVHVQKTAGTSITEVLRPLCLTASGGRIARLGSDLGLVRDWRRYHFRKHAPLRRAERVLPAEAFASFYKFAFVRNPWDLQVSSFHHLRRERRHLLGDAAEFGEFLRRKLDPKRAYQYHIDTSMQLQVDYLVDLRGEVLVDFLGRYERLEADFREACSRIGIKGRKLPHRRQAVDRKADYRRYYTDETAELVARHFARDIELLDYRFDP